MMGSPAWLNMEPMEEAALRAIASPRRREILRLVWDRELSSGDIASHFDVSWPAISQNLRVLEGAELVRTRRCGTARLYRANRSRPGPRYMHTARATPCGSVRGDRVKSLPKRST